VARVIAAALPGPRDADEPLLLLALSRPKEALAQARAVLADHPDPFAASVAHQAAGIVVRDFGDSAAGLHELRAALRLARRTGSPDREADVLATLGLTLFYAGRTSDAMTAFDRAIGLSAGVVAGRVLYRRSIVLWKTGHHEAALDDVRRAIAVLRRAGDKVWTARALGLRGNVYMTMGQTARADADFRAAGLLWAETGQVLEAIYSVQNRGEAASAAGDLPAALSFLDEAATRYQPTGVPMELVISRCVVLLAAGLAGEALTEADAAIGDIDQIHGWATQQAELLLTAANCALAAGQHQAALERGRTACRVFRTLRSSRWLAQSGLVLVQARYATEPVSAKLLRAAREAVARLEAVAPADAAPAHLLAGRIAMELGRGDDADRHLAAAALSRLRGPALARATGWLAEALRAKAACDSRRLLAACRAGLAVLDEHRFTLGASELRAQATSHGAELALLAQRHAVRAGQPRLLLRWSDRWRATTLAVPGVRPPTDPELTVGMAALRDVTSRLEQARRHDRRSSTASLERAVLQREQRRLEGVVRACALRVPGLADPGRAYLDVPELLDRLGQAQLADIVVIDGSVHVLVCGAGTVRQFAAGRADDAVRAAAFARFALRRLARSRPGDDLASASAILAAVGPKLQEALLGPAARYLSDRPVIIVPPGNLQAIPWALLPVLRDRVVSVTPSASAWLRAQAARPPSRHHVALACGPGLSTDGAEVPKVARLYEDVTVLSDGDATADRVLRALDGAWLAHIAAHGTFRADSPLFSSLRMHDGPLTVYDFEQLRRAPYRLVLSSCDLGAGAATGADELLGLVSSLLPMGTAGIVASAVPLNDEAVVPVMLDLHHHLKAGRTLAEAMHGIRTGLDGDPIKHATAASLVALGAA
jgi:tetratricopeptide (TPR) repeat protein